MPGRDSAPDPSLGRRRSQSLPAVKRPLLASQEVATDDRGVLDAVKRKRLQLAATARSAHPAIAKAQRDDCGRRAASVVAAPSLRGSRLDHASPRSGRSLQPHHRQRWHFLLARCLFDPQELDAIPLTEASRSSSCGSFLPGESRAKRSFSESAGIEPAKDSRRGANARRARTGWEGKTLFQPCRDVPRAAPETAEED
jgi:hypothetical protein